MNLCRACSEDFSSVAAFDRHRTGTHEYTFSEGLSLDPPREDGRRCMDSSEMLEAGMEPDARGRWRIVLNDSEKERLEALRAKASPPEGLRGVREGADKGEAA